MPNITIQLLKVLEQDNNIQFTGAHQTIYQKRATSWLQANNINNIENFIDQISQNKQIRDEFIDWLIVKSSYFFRNCLIFELIFQEIIPKLLQQAEKIGSDSIRFWSAGCSTGEEPYSLAILIKEISKQSLWSVPTYIFGTDISRNALDHARSGIYTKEKLQETKLKIVETYFSKTNDNFIVVDSLKKMVDFSEHDLLSTSGFLPAASVFGSFDLVLCRNVLIYYPMEIQDQIIKRLIDSINEGGYLILGETESITKKHFSQMRHVDSHTRIFQKKEI